jgi:hypothetical protein
MTQINGYLIVPVPEGATDIHLDDKLAPGKLLWKEVYDEAFIYEFLPEGDWSIVEIDERVAHNIIDKKVKEYGEVWIYNDYVTGKALFTALESYSSLLKSKGYENVICLPK